jgi:hypothetical protein
VSLFPPEFWRLETEVHAEDKATILLAHRCPFEAELDAEN